MKEFANDRDFSDGQLYKKFDHAAYSVLKDYGLEMELLPEEKWEKLPEIEGIERVLVSRNVTEFGGEFKVASRNRNGDPGSQGRKGCALPVIF